MSDEPEVPRRFEEIAEAPSDPGEVASAARSCSAILIILLALALVVCVFAAIALVR